MRQIDNSPIHFAQLFARAEERGLLLQDVGNALLRHACSGSCTGKVTGIRRRWEYVFPSQAERQAQQQAEETKRILDEQWENASSSPDERLVIATKFEALKAVLEPFEGWRELPRDPIPRPVPIDIWRMLDRVEADCTAHWDDGDEDEAPNAWTTADLISGTVEDVWWEEKKVVFASLHIDGALAESILSNPTASTNVAALPLGKFSDEERQAWILDRAKRPGTGDEAHKEFEKHFRWDGTNQAAWRLEWRKLTGRGPGRRSKNNP